MRYLLSTIQISEFDFRSPGGDSVREQWEASGFCLSFSYSNVSSVTAGYQVLISDTLFPDSDRD